MGANNSIEEQKRIQNIIQRNNGDFNKLHKRGLQLTNQRINGEYIQVQHQDNCMSCLLQILQNL
jgi:hypothetical protein